jgi:O-antigen/teichoic acid export membrane protein
VIRRGPKSLISRLVGGIGVTALGPIVTSAIQLGSVPLLLHAWGPSKYGDWLLLFAVPSYLSFSGLGFGDSSASEMTMLVAAGDRRGALGNFQSSWLLLSAMSLAVLFVAAAIVWWVPWQAMLHLAGVTNSQGAQIILALSLWILAGQQSNVLESGYRCSGNFVLGNLGSTFQRVSEAIVGTIVGVVTGSLLAVALSYVACRIAGMMCYGMVLRHVSPWLKLGFHHASISTVKKMVKPSLGFMAMPIGFALSIQGFTLVIGMVLGPIAVTVFATARTLTRAGSQLIYAIGNGIWPEFSSAFGSGDLSLARKLHRHAYQASLILSVSCALFLWMFGPAFYRVWVRKAVPLDLACFHILLLVTIANSLWYASAIVQMSANKHSRLAFVFLVATGLSCILGYFLTREFGLAGAASAVLLTDLAMCRFALRTSLKQMHDTPGAFLRAVFGSTRYILRPLLANCGLRR